MSRTALYERKTKETRISVSLALDGTGAGDIRTPIAFLSHMLGTMAAHGRFDLRLEAEGDLDVDQHHLVEDCGLCLGEAFRRALEDFRGIRRAGSVIMPMDDALALAAVDLGGRPFLQCEASFRRRHCGGLDTDALDDFLTAFANGLRANVAVRVLAGRSDHHKMEAVFKALGRALREACAADDRGRGDVPSLKGRIDNDRDR
jgi:imidazoleglycerol-phosphate dehydratase